MAAHAFEPILASFQLLGPIGLAAVFVVPAGIYALFNRRLRKKPEVPQLIEGALITPLQILVLWYLISAITYQARHGRYAFQALWPSSFAAAAFLSAFILVVAITRKLGERWFVAVSFAISTLIFALLFQLVTYFSSLVAWEVGWLSCRESLSPLRERVGRGVRRANGGLRRRPLSSALRGSSLSRKGRGLGSHEDTKARRGQSTPPYP